jgi:hypothetical protein
MSWANRKGIIVVAALFVAGSALLWFCLNLAAPWLGIFPERTPVSVAFLGYTNSPMAGLNQTVPNALFAVSNVTASPLTCRMIVEALHHGERSFYAHTLLFGAHSVERIEVLTLEGGEDWQFQVSLAAIQARPRWQQKIGSALDRVWLRPASFTQQKVYLPVTNVLTKPSSK